MSSGYLITLEGPEGAGKSSQIKLLEKALKERGFKVLSTYEPGGGNQLTLKIRQLLLSRDYFNMAEETELFLMLAARVEHVKKLILPALASGTIVLSDRFTDSSLAYQGYGRGLELQTIINMNTFAIKGRKPDLTFVLDLPTAVGLRRAALKSGPDRIEMEDISFHEKVRQGFLALCDEGAPYYKIDANRDQELVHLDILNRVFKLLGYENR